MHNIFLFLALLIVHPTKGSLQNLQKFSLDGEWLFRADSLRVGIDGEWYADSSDRSDWQGVFLPGYWASYPGMSSRDGWGWFARSLDLARIPGPMSLVFAGVDDEATVWVNGQEVGGHNGYREPFALDVSRALHEGSNTFVVLVKDPSGGGRIYEPVTLIENTGLEEVLHGACAGESALKSAEWVRDAVIYSVYVRSFSPEGTFAGLEKRIPELKSLGATVLWLLPIHPVGLLHRKGRLGSPYSVRDYYAVNPEFGTMADFQRLVTAVHKSGMKLILDLVANHTSWDSKLMEEHPEWFSRNAKGEIISPNPDWSDVADLNYHHSGLRQYMIDMMVWWVRDIGVDGFRCDVAELVPVDFWNEARGRLNRIKPVMMLSEGSLPEHHRKAFDITYSWTIYNALDLLLRGKRPPELLDQILKTEEQQFPKGSLRLRFTTNHDKNAWDAPAVKKFGLNGLKLGTVLVNTLPGVPLLYNGEEIPNDRRLSLFEKVPIDWSRPRKLESLEKTLFTLRSKHRALSRGQMIRVPSSDDEAVYAFVRVAGNDRLLVVLNFSDEERTVRLQLPLGRLLPGEGRPKFDDLLSNASIPLSPVDPKEMQLDLRPKGFALYRF
jgi:glycosidase